jgi:fumarate reductase flavoprotein subunit
MAEREKVRQLEADLVVIGGGGAGMVAALTAIENGITDVIVLEKRFVIGGNSSMAGGFVFAVESHLQKANGVTTTCDEVFKEVMAFHHYDRVNPRIIRAFLNKSGDTIKWLEDRGAPFKWTAGVHIMKDAKNPFGNFKKVMRLLADKFRSGGGRILTHASARRLQRGQDGSVTGVIAVAKNGEELQIKTRSIMLATGGFTGNRELLRHYFPYYYDEGYGTDAIPNMGDGIQLAAEAGACLEDHCTLIRETGYSFTRRKNMPVRAFMTEGTIWVNRKGERFADETPSRNNACTNAVLAQPGKCGFALFDDKLVQGIIDSSSKADMPAGLPEQKGPDIREAFQAEDKNGEWVKIAGTWEGLAGWIGAEPGTLKRTIDEYNSFCDKGHDDLFAKDKRLLVPLHTPPFYALKFCPLMIDTAGPVRVNERMEVLDRQDKPIPGFYTGGVITSGNWGYDYHLFGSALGYTLSSGRIAGESIVKFLLGR